MVGVNLRNANRLNENLTGVNFTGANLTGANLAQVKLDGAIGLYQWPGMGENWMQSPPSPASHGSRQQAPYIRMLHCGADRYQNSRSPNNIAP